MISLLLIIFYTLIFIFCLLKISRSYRNYFSARQVTLSFVLKVTLGMVYGFLFWKFYNGDDTWLYHYKSLAQYQNLLLQPVSFFQDINVKTSGSTSLGSLYDTTGSFWNKLDDVLFIKLLTVFDVFSFGHYYVNVVLFCFIVFLGHLLLFRVLTEYYPESAAFFRITIFYHPMIVFWLSGIRKEGILFVALALVLFCFNRLISIKRRFVVNMLFTLVGLVLLFVMRNFMCMCLIPSLLAWTLCRRFKWNPPVTFAGVYVACVVMFFVSGMIPGLPNMAEKVTQRQYEYLGLVANTRLPLDSLKGTALSYLHVLPQAINHSFFRPYITETRGILQALSATDLFIFFAVAVLSAWYHKSNWKNILGNPVILCCLFTSLFAYILIGYTVPYPGTFVRYKAIFELLFVCIFAAVADPQKIRNNFVLTKNHIFDIFKKTLRLF